MGKVVWIQGQNSCGKTLKIKEMLGYQWKCREPDLQLIKQGIIAEGGVVTNILEYVKYSVADEVAPLHVKIWIGAGKVSAYPKCSCCNCKKLRRRVKSIYEAIQRYEETLNEISFRLTDAQKLTQHHKYYVEQYEALSEKLRDVKLAIKRFEESLLGQEYVKRLDKLYERGYFELSEEEQRKRFDEFTAWEKRVELPQNQLYKVYNEAIKIDIKDMERRVQSLSLHTWELQKARHTYEDLKEYRTKSQVKLKTKLRELRWALQECCEVDVWVDGFMDAVKLWKALEYAKNFRVKRLFVSHCGPKFRIEQLKECQYLNWETHQWIHGIDVLGFPAEEIYIEVPTEHQTLTIS